MKWMSCDLHKQYCSLEFSHYILLTMWVSILSKQNILGHSCLSFHYFSKCLELLCHIYFDCFRDGSLSIRSLFYEHESSCGRRVTRHMLLMKKQNKRLWVLHYLLVLALKCWHGMAEQFPFPRESGGWWRHGEPGHWLKSVLWHWWLGDRKDIWPVLCLLSWKVLLQNRWRSETEGRPANPGSPAKWTLNSR